MASRPPPPQQPPPSTPPPPVGQPPIWGMGHGPAVSGTMLGPESCMVTCPTCNAMVSTTTRKQITSKTHLFFFIMCITGILCPCACAVYICDCCKSTFHYCPNCGNFLGSFE